MHLQGASLDMTSHLVANKPGAARALPVLAHVTHRTRVAVLAQATLLLTAVITHSPELGLHWDCLQMVSSACLSEQI